jgi:guanine deaminase
LVDICERIGQRALIGKVNMDRNSPDSLTETAQQSISDTRKFIKYVLGKRNLLLTPVITPRFAPSCTPELLEALGKMAAEFSVPIQSHLSENRKECGR